MAFLNTLALLMLLDSDSGQVEFFGRLVKNKLCFDNQQSVLN